MTMAQANQWNALGDFGRAQSMLRQSMETTNMALGIAGAAQNAYDQSAGIILRRGIAVVCFRIHT